LFSCVDAAAKIVFYYVSTILAAVLLGKEKIMKKQWFEDEAFWQHFAPVMFESDRWAEAPAVVDGLQYLCGLENGAGVKVADLCCGMGRIAVELARRDFTVTGVDITASYLQAAAELAKDEVQLELIQADVRDFVRPQAYDLALNMYTSFGYFDDPADDLRFVSNARQSLKRGGQFVIEVDGKELTARDFSEDEWFEREGWTVLTEYRPVNNWGGLWHRWIVFQDGQRFERSFVRRMYSATEMEALLRQAGFASVEFYGDWDGIPYDHNARVMIAIAKV
jgi:SAM-dependent methyltransferase